MVRIVSGPLSHDKTCHSHDGAHCNYDEAKGVVWLIGPASAIDVSGAWDDPRCRQGDCKPPEDDQKPEDDRIGSRFHRWSLNPDLRYLRLTDGTVARWAT